MTDTPASDASDSIDTVLRSDHAAIKRAIAQLRTNLDPRATGELFGELSADLVRHLVAEEQYLLPAVRHHLPDGAELSKASFAEHEHLEQLLRAVDQDDVTDDEVGSALGRLAEAIDVHVATQEHQVLPALVEAVGAAELSELGRGVLGAEQLAPTHPRAFVPRSATINKITAWLSGLIDKTIDAGDPDDPDDPDER